MVDIYTVKGNGFRIPRDYGSNHLTLGNLKEIYRAISPANIRKGSRSPGKMQHHILVQQYTLTGDVS